ncbi:MAG: hypothetical protein NTW85_08555 [Methylococcales bacterium]|nr:hypothetical protein [Methylococcales bacterium]
MSQITLELKNNEDEQLVLTLLQRLGISYSTLNETTNKNLDYHRHIIEQGVDIEDFDSFLQAFNDNRQDRNLPFNNL